jgi:hypothetical protein
MLGLTASAQSKSTENYHPVTELTVQQMMQLVYLFPNL